MNFVYKKKLLCFGNVIILYDVKLAYVKFVFIYLLKCTYRQKQIGVHTRTHTHTHTHTQTHTLSLSLSTNIQAPHSILPFLPSVFLHNSIFLPSFTSHSILPSFLQFTQIYLPTLLSILLSIPQSIVSFPSFSFPSLLHFLHFPLTLACTLMTFLVGSCL